MLATPSNFSGRRSTRFNADVGSARGRKSWGLDGVDGLQLRRPMGGHFLGPAYEAIKAAHHRR